VVYSYTPSADGWISVSTCGSSYDTEVEIYDHMPGTYSMPLACNDDWCGLSSGIEAVWLSWAHMYFITVDGFGGSSGDYIVHVVAGIIAPGLNDCSNPLPGGETIATAQVIGSPITVCGNTCDMSDDYNSTCGQSGGLDAVYSFTPNFTGAINVALCGSEYDTELYIMNSDATYLDCNDDYCWYTGGTSNYASGIPNFPVVNGVTYYIGVDGYSGSDCGIYYLRIERRDIPCAAADELFTYCTPTNEAIPDVDSVLVGVFMPFSYSVASVSASIDLTHTYDADLIITLRSPAGTRVILSNQNGGSGDNFHCTVFDDEASTPIMNGVAPFEGDFIPDEALSAFDGENPLGNWTFIVSDNAGQDVGQILGCCVMINPVSLPVDPSGATTVTDYALHQNYPNPFNPQTNIAFDLAAPGAVKLEVFNTLGQSVYVLYEGTLSAGPHMAVFDAAGLPSGVYFYRLQAGDFVDIKKMALMK
jgi:subtilisin-like proprotein convertase family protein